MGLEREKNINTFPMYIILKWLDDKIKLFVRPNRFIRPIFEANVKLF